jgi:hypothetical protein
MTLPEPFRITPAMPRRIPKGMKWCRMCHAVKSLEEFHLAKKGGDIRRANCKECACESMRKGYRSRSGMKMSIDR